MLLNNLRVYDYSSIPNVNLPLKIDRLPIQFNIANKTPIGLESQYPYNPAYGIYGFVLYGDGTAKAAAVFINGLVTSQGQYIDATGHLSGFDVLQSADYNDFTYEITLEKEIAEYKTMLLDLLHPMGTKVLGRYVMEQIEKGNSTVDIVLNGGHPLSYYTGNPGSYATMTSNWDNESNNIIKFEGLSGANLENFIFSNTVVELTTSNGYSISSKVISVLDGNANTVTIADNVWLIYANVATIHADASSGVINIDTITNSYDIMINGEYSDPENPLKDIVFAGDKILVANNIERQVSSVDYANNRIYVSPVLVNAATGFLSVQRKIETTDVNIMVQ